MYGDARIAIQELKQASLMCPNDNMFLHCDAMDNQKSYVPRLLENPKEYVGSDRLASKISGVIVYSGWYKEQRKCSFYLNHDQVFFIIIY